MAVSIISKLRAAQAKAGARRARADKAGAVRAPERPSAPPATAAPLTEPDESSAALALAETPAALVPAGPFTVGPADVLRLWLHGRAPATARAYLTDLEAFGLWAAQAHGAPTEAAGAVSWLLSHPGGSAQALVLEWRGAMIERGAPNTVNRRLAALRSITKLARMLGVTEWVIEVPNVRGGNVRDTRGPTEGQVRLLHAATQQTSTPERDWALVCLILALGLRREEAARLNVSDYDATARKVTVRGKGGTLHSMSVPVQVAEALSQWLAVRPRKAAPGDERLLLLSTPAVYWRVGRIGKLAGFELRPHGLRHSAITAGLEATSGDVRRVKAFSRHAKVETVLRYDDARVDHAGQVADAVSDRLLNHNHNKDNGYDHDDDDEKDEDGRE